MARQASKGAFGEPLGPEIASYLGVSRYEHASDQHDYRNGHSSRHLLTEMGDLELLCRAARKEKFPSKLFERYARRCRSADAASLACFCLGSVHARSHLGADYGAGRESLGFHDFAHRAVFGP